MLLCFVALAAAMVVLFLRFEAYRDVLSAIPFVVLLADGSIGWAVTTKPRLRLIASMASLSFSTSPHIRPIPRARAISSKRVIRR